MLFYDDLSEEDQKLYKDFNRGYVTLVSWRSYSYGLYNTHC